MSASFDKMPTEAPLLSFEELQARAAASLESGKRNFRALLAAESWLTNLKEEALRIPKEHASARSKYAKLRVLADRIHDATAPYVACERNCSHCCHRSVPITAHEAAILSEVSGRPLTTVKQAAGPRTVADDLPTTACPFLAEGACSIYEHRPIACRIKFNLSDDDFYCDPALAPEGTVPPALNMDVFLMAYAQIFAKQPLSDIRSFFSVSNDTSPAA